MWWPKALTYGNFGGPGWSGGIFTNDPKMVNWKIPAVDEMDAIFKIHDWKYQNGKSRRDADQILYLRLSKTNINGIWSNIYRIGCLFIFSIKLAIPWIGN